MFKSTEQRFVLILGMHRSGTSCLAGCLRCCGLHLGRVNRRNECNAKGTFEQNRVMRVHDDILESNGGSWRDPPGAIEVSDAQQAAILGIVRQLRWRRQSCGVKDPRLLLVVEAWLDAVDNADLVGTFRHPSAVARSLAVRDGIPLDESLDLWLAYNRRLAELHATRRFPLIEYALEPADEYRNSVCSLARSLGLRSSHRRIQSFVSKSLDHSLDNQAVPPACREVYDYLNSHRLRLPASAKERGPSSGASLGGRFQEAIHRAATCVIRRESPED